MIKKLVIKATLMIAGLFVVMMVLPGPNGEPMMSVQDLPGYSLFSAANKAVDKVSTTVAEAHGHSEIYTWVDASGAIHYSDTPIEGSERHELSSVNNAIPAENFTGEAYAPIEKKTSSPRSFFIKDSNTSSRKAKFNSSTAQANNSSSQLSSQDFSDLAEGDLSNAGEILQQLPDFLQEAQQERIEALR